jgi:hypothetical protein
MKKLKFLVVMPLFLLLQSCCNNNEESPTPTLAGKWKLINVSGGFVGVNDNFPPGQITWDINPDASSVTVVNNNTNSDLQDILESGVYDYSLTPDPNSICPNTFTVNNLDLGCYSVSNTALIISYDYADGMRLQFIR